MMRDGTAQRGRGDIPSLRVSSICPGSCNSVTIAWPLERSSKACRADLKVGSGLCGVQVSHCSSFHTET